jgi:hypothetical protein
VFLPVLVLVAGLALPAPSRAASGPDDDARKKGADEAGKDDTKADDKKDEKKDDKEQPKEPAFDKAVKGAKKIEGLFNVYIKEDEARFLLEIAPDQLETPFLLNPTLVSGIGQGFLYPSDMLPEYVVLFHRNGKTIQVIHKNALFRADESSSMRQPAAVAAPDAVVGQAKIECQPHPNTKSVLIDIGTVFVGDLEGMGPALKQIFEAPYQLDKDGSAVSLVRGFPGNLDFETVLHFKTPEVNTKKPVVYAADPRSLLVRFHYSISRLPQTGYRPRLADDRVGHFLAMVDDYSGDRDDQPTVRYVTRWQLEKTDPSAAVSEPKQPIVFYLENTIPREYRDAVRRGVLNWNPVFEAIGFKDAVVVKEQPDDKEWDAADVRYASLRWIVAPNAGFAQGPSRVNPYTGQIFDADIRFSADMLRGVRREYDELVAPVTLPAAPGSETAALVRALSGWTSMLGPYTLDSLLDPHDGAFGEPARRQVLGAGSRPGTPPAALGYCDYASGLTHEAALGWDVLQARGLLVDPKDQDRYVNDFIVAVTMHEVGHTLGLRHNFKASNVLPFDRLNDASLTARNGLTGSVMDYIPVNLAPEGKPQGEYFQSTPGPYDYWAIEYAYRPLEAASPEAETPALRAIATRVSEPDLAYGTDEDTFTGSPRGIDPTSNMWDLGSDILGYYRTRADISRELLGKMEDRFNEPGMRYQKLRLVFSQAVGEIAPAALNVPKYIGGIRHYRDHIGDPNGRLPYDPVPAAEQRAALGFMNREIFGADAFRLPPRLFNKLAVERFPDIEGNFWTIDRIDLPIHTLVLALQSLAMDRLYHPIVLSRLVDIEQRYEGKEKAFTLAEMFASVRQAVWSELDGRSNINSFRRNLQRKHLSTLVNLAVQSDPAQPEDARTLARVDLIQIRRAIDTALGRVERPVASLDTVTRAHLDETRARITAALDAGMERQIPPPTRPQG